MCVSQFDNVLGVVTQQLNFSIFSLQVLTPNFIKVIGFHAETSKPMKLGVAWGQSSKQISSSVWPKFFEQWPYLPLQVNLHMVGCSLQLQIPLWQALLFCSNNTFIQQGSFRSVTECTLVNEWTEAGRYSSSGSPESQHQSLILATTGSHWSEISTKDQHKTRSNEK